MKLCVFSWMVPKRGFANKNINENNMHFCLHLTDKQKKNQLYQTKFLDFCEVSC